MQSNMISIFYLEVLSLTKLQANKSEKDAKVGHFINAIVQGFYMVVFITIISCSYAPLETSEGLIYVAKTWYTPISAFNQTQQKLIYYFGQLLMVGMLFCHALIDMLVALESFLIYKDELDRNSMSNLIDE